MKDVINFAITHEDGRPMTNRERHAEYLKAIGETEKPRKGRRNLVLEVAEAIVEEVSK